MGESLIHLNVHHERIFFPIPEAIADRSDKDLALPCRLRIHISHFLASISRTRSHFGLQDHIVECPCASTDSEARHDREAVARGGTGGGPCNDEFEIGWRV